ncbi:MAG: DUF4440 domain-containing protein [Acidobacteriota bacterium]
MNSKKALAPRSRLRPTAATPLEAVQNLTEAWINKDAAGMSEWLTDHITEIGPAHRFALNGKPGFLRKYQAYFMGALRVKEYRILRPKIVALTPRLALVHFSYRMITQTDSVVERTRGKESMLVEKIGASWKVRFIHWHRDPDLPGGL